MASSGVLHAFIDESGRTGKDKYMVCASTLTSSDVSGIRTGMLALRTRGTSRIHMKNEGRNAQRIINGVAALDVHSYLYVVRKSCNFRTARDLAFSELFGRLSTIGVKRAVIESCGEDHRDRKIIHDVLSHNPALEYLHEPASTGNPLLWIPDVHAWAWGRGGKARAAIEHRVTVQVLK